MTPHPFVHGIHDVSEVLKSQTYYLIIGPFSFAIVNAVDGDITVESSDLALFKLHRNNLQAYAGAIPLPESASSPSGSSAVDIIQVLPEPASVLETVFEFLYPKRYYPELEDVEFVKLMAVAETVEKYQVFAALPLCVVRLK